MKAITWDAAARLFKEVVTGRIFTASSEPVDIADGDLWVDNSTTPVLKAKVGGIIYDVVSVGGGGGPDWIGSIDDGAPDVDINAYLYILTSADGLSDTVVATYGSSFSDGTPTVTIV